MSNECPNELTIEGTLYVKKSSLVSAIGTKGPLTLVRTFSAGVHIGELVSRDGIECVLANARRLWYWKGAFSLSEASQNGVASGSRISQPVPIITLTQAVELIPVSTKAAPSLTTSTEK